jgi:transposase
VPVEQIAYIDESGLDTYLYREYGRSKRGVPIVTRISGRKYRRVGVVAAQIGKEIVSPLQYDGTMNSSLFEMWFEEMLLPILPPKTTIVMDNATFHRKKTLRTLAENKGHRVVFLPPYSPELNPIEHFWSWLKRYMKKHIDKYMNFDETLCSAFDVS